MDFVAKLLKSSPTPHQVFFERNPPERQAVLEREFFNRVCTANGTFKTTANNRLDDVNQVLLPYVRRFEAPEILDVAVSSGITTVEWFDYLSQFDLRFRLVATDICVNSSLVSLRFVPFFSAIFDKDENLIHVSVCGRGWITHRQLNPKSFAGLLTLLTRWFVRAASRTIPAILHREPLMLVTSGIANRSIKVEEDDLLEENRPEFLRRFHVVRAANIVNKGYFPEPLLRKMIDNLKGRLRPEGFLIVCRTHSDGKNHGTVFQLRGSRLCAVQRLGMGSEVEDLVGDCR
jgi:hypothetical protein